MIIRISDRFLVGVHHLREVIAIARGNLIEAHVNCAIEHPESTASAMAYASEFLRALIDIRDSAVYDKAAKARASQVIDAWHMFSARKSEVVTC